MAYQMESSLSSSVTLSDRWPRMRKWREKVLYNYIAKDVTQPDWSDYISTVASCGFVSFLCIWRISRAYTSTRSSAGYLLRLTQWSRVTGRLHVPIVGRLRSTGRSDQSDRPVVQTVTEQPTSVNQINVAC